MQHYFLRNACLGALALVVGASAALADAIADPVVTRAAPNRLVVTWGGEGPIDVYVGEKASIDAGAMRLISDDDIDGRHEYQSDSRARPYFLLRSHDGVERRVAERVLPLEAGSNFRDVGGYRTSEGKSVRWGLIYRTGAMPQLTDGDYALLNALGIRVFCDLRSVEERVLAPTRSAAVPGSRYAAVDYPASDIYRRLLSRGPNAAVNDAPQGAANAARNLYREWPVSLATQFKEIFDALIAGEAPLAFNCSAGQDRTGVATALVLSALGVPRATILEDYHLSTLHRRPEFERGTADYAALAATNVVAQYYVESRKQGPDAQKPRPLYDESGRARLLATFDEIATRWGSVERYLDEVLEIDAADVRRLRALYLE